MDKEEYHKRLKEDKWFESPEELIDHRLPCLQYYLDNEFNMNINGHSLKGIQIIYKEDDFTLVNEAFLSLRKRYGYDK
jgi:hypothetical protein